MASITLVIAKRLTASLQSMETLSASNQGPLIATVPVPSDSGLSLDLEYTVEESGGYVGSRYKCIQAEVPELDQQCSLSTKMSSHAGMTAT